MLAYGIQVAVYVGFNESSDEQALLRAKEQ